MQWISIAERLPDRDRPVCVTNGGVAAIAILYLDEWCPEGVIGLEPYSTIVLNFVPTHWMPLPDLPQEANTKVHRSEIDYQALLDAGPLPDPPEES